MRKLLLVAALAGLSACGSSGAQISLSNPNYFSAKADRKTDVMRGQFNPARFTTAQVRKLVGSVCDGGRLSGFTTAYQDGLSAFETSCSTGFNPAIGLVEFERSGPEVIIEILGSDGKGNIKLQKRQTAH